MSPWKSLIGSFVSPREIACAQQKIIHRPKTRKWLECPQFAGLKSSDPGAGHRHPGQDAGPAAAGSSGERPPSAASHPQEVTRKSSE